MNQQDVITLWQVSGIRDFSDFLTTLLPVEEWDWYDLYLRVLYQFYSVADEGARITALAATLSVKMNGKYEAKDVSAMREGESPVVVLQANVGGRTELVQRLHFEQYDAATLAGFSSRFVVQGSDWQQATASIRRRCEIRLELGHSSDNLSGEPDLIRALIAAEQ